MGKVRQQAATVVTAAVTIVIWISTLAMVIPQAAYAQQDERNPSSSSSDGEDCGSDELPASIDGTISCISPGECYSSDFEFDGEQVKHCNY
jgi:hypothetical protein